MTTCTVGGGGGGLCGRDRVNSCILGGCEVAHQGPLWTRHYITTPEQINPIQPETACSRCLHGILGQGALLDRAALGSPGGGSYGLLLLALRHRLDKLHQLSHILRCSGDIRECHERQTEQRPTELMANGRLRNVPNTNMLLNCKL